MRRSTCPRVDKPFVIAGRTFASRLIVGTGKYKNYAENAAALEASGAEMVTVAVRRVNLTDPSQPRLVDFIDPKKYTYLPNTAGCFTGEDAVRTLRLAREAGGWTLVKLEVLGEKKLLYPDMIETLRATEMLIKDGFQVMVYCSDDPLMAKRLEDMGAVAIMPLAAPIGSGMGIQNHGEHPHDRRGGQGAGDRRCRRRHGVGRRGRDGTGLRRGDIQHRHRRCQGPGADGARDEARGGGGPPGLAGGPHAQESLCRSVQPADRPDLETSAFGWTRLSSVSSSTAPGRITPLMMKVGVPSMPGACRQRVAGGDSGSSISGSLHVGFSLFTSRPAFFASA